MPSAARALIGLLLVACGRPVPGAPAAAASDPVMAELTAELARGPARGAVLYALAKRSDQLGRVEDALRWLERLAATGWDVGLDPSDFATSAAKATARYGALREALAVRWTQRPTARERVRLRGERDLLPEGIERDPATGDLLVSSLRKRKVIRVAADGTPRDLVSPGQDGLLATLGLRVDGERGALWVASTAAPFMERAADTASGTSRLHAFELATGRLRARYELAGPSLLNDVAVLPDGRAVVTDTAANLVWVTARDRLEPLTAAGAIVEPNGIAVSERGELLYVASWYGIMVVDLATRAVAPLGLPADATDLSGIDGLYVHAGALVGLQNAVGHPRVVRLPLAADGRAARGVEVIEAGSSVVDNPTTGVVAGGALLFLARRNRESAFVAGAPTPVLEEVVIASVPLGAK